MENGTEKPEFWEKSFVEKQEMWGFEPAASAMLARDVFLERSVKQVLLPGIGYGRNAQVFRESGMKVTGIEISETAIDIAHKHYGSSMTIYHGSVSDMPYDENRYDGIFCHGLIYLLDEAGRKKLIRDCYNQLEEGGCMIFTVITKEATTYGTGTLLSKDRYEMFGGVQLYFYDRESVAAEFGDAGLAEIIDVKESYPFFLIKCFKGRSK